MPILSLFLKDLRNVEIQNHLLALEKKKVQSVDYNFSMATFQNIPWKSLLTSDLFRSRLRNMVCFLSGWSQKCHLNKVFFLSFIFFFCLPVSLYFFPFLLFLSFFLILTLISFIYLSLHVFPFLFFLFFFILFKILQNVGT